MEDITSGEFSEQKQQDIKNARQKIELVFMNSCRFICPDNGRLDYKFMLQHIQELVDDKDKLEQEADLLSIDVDIFRQAVFEILNTKLF